ncbi:MAG: hypothetical protein V1839_01965 [archaeon]
MSGNRTYTKSQYSALETLKSKSPLYVMTPDLIKITNIEQSELEAILGCQKDKVRFVRVYSDGRVCTAWQFKNPNKCIIPKKAPRKAQKKPIEESKEPIDLIMLDGIILHKDCMRTEEQILKIRTTFVYNPKRKAYDLSKYINDEDKPYQK